jgi:hypothetical protein
MVSPAEERPAEKPPGRKHRLKELEWQLLPHRLATISPQCSTNPWAAPPPAALKAAW